MVSLGRPTTSYDSTRNHGQAVAGTWPVTEFEKIGEAGGWEFSCCSRG